MAKAGRKPLVLGFMTVVENDRSEIRGGYLLVNQHGRPIEFHYTDPLMFTRPQRLLYGASFEPVVYGELLGKGMTDRQGTAPGIVLVDHQALLELRPHVPAPVLLPLIPAEGRDPGADSPPPRCHPRFPQDLAAFSKIGELVSARFDWAEPFDRIHRTLDAVSETVGNRLVA